MLSVEQESPRQEEVSALLTQADAYSATLYPEEGRYHVDVDFLALPHVRFFVARMNGRAVGCGALVLGADGEAELKRMIVDLGTRRRGVGRAILQAIEDAAAHDGISMLRLETGPGNKEALALYERSGFRSRGPFGSYVPGPFSVFLEKRIPSG